MNLLHTLGAFFLAVSLPACGEKHADPVFAEIIHIEPISVVPKNATSVAVKYRVTNKSSVQIVRVRTRLAVFDAAGAEIGARDGHYVVRGAVGGLAPGGTLEAETSVSAKDPARVVKAAFQIQFTRDATGKKTLVEGAATGADD